jgi:hypothetical protein
VIERKVEISHERCETHAHVLQFTTTTLEISTAAKEVSDTGRGSSYNPRTRRKTILEY